MLVSKELFVKHYKEYQDSYKKLYEHFPMDYDDIDDPVLEFVNELIIKFGTLLDDLAEINYGSSTCIDFANPDSNSDYTRHFHYTDPKTKQLKDANLETAEAVYDFLCDMYHHED